MLMPSTKNLFNRTVKTNIILYPTDGMGRDGYITHNDGGFWKENIKPVVPKESFNRYRYARVRSLGRTPPMWNYQSDGTGRDTYILYNFGGLIRKYDSLANNKIQTFLRVNDEQTSPKRYVLSKAEKREYMKLRKIQNDVTNRLYRKNMKRNFSMPQFLPNNTNSQSSQKNSYKNVFNGVSNSILSPIKDKRFLNDNCLNKKIGESSIYNRSNSNLNLLMKSEDHEGCKSTINQRRFNNQRIPFNMKYMSNSVDDKVSH